RRLLPSCTFVADTPLMSAVPSAEARSPSGDSPTLRPMNSVASLVAVESPDWTSESVERLRASIDVAPADTAPITCPATPSPGAQPPAAPEPFAPSPPGPPASPVPAGPPAPPMAVGEAVAVKFGSSSPTKASTLFAEFDSPVSTLLLSELLAPTIDADPPAE